MIKSKTLNLLVLVNCFEYVEPSPPITSQYHHRAPGFTKHKKYLSNSHPSTHFFRALRVKMLKLSYGHAAFASGDSTVTLAPSRHGHHGHHIAKSRLKAPPLALRRSPKSSASPPAPPGVPNDSPSGPSQPIKNHRKIVLKIRENHMKHDHETESVPHFLNSTPLSEISSSITINTLRVFTIVAETSSCLANKQ